MLNQYSLAMKKLSFTLFLSILFVISSSAQPLSGNQIDSLVTLTLKTFDVPGISVGVIKDGNLMYAKGYGIANLRSGKKVDEYTLFGIA